MANKSTLKTLRFSNNGLSVAGNTVLYVFKKNKNYYLYIDDFVWYILQKFEYKSFMLNFL